MASCCAWFCILGIGIPYFAWIAPKIFVYYGPLLPILNGFFYLNIIIGIILTGFTDPGIIPRKQILLL